MRRLVLTTLAVIALSLAGTMAVRAGAIDGYPGGNCPGYDGPTKVDTSDGSIVLPAGTIFCIHASNTNSGLLVADGVSTLADYIAATIVNGGGQVPNVSNYVTYGEQPSAPPEETSPPPDESATPSAEPSEQPTVEPSSPSLPSPDASTGVPPTPPNTATEETSSERPLDTPAHWLAVVLFGAVLGYVLLTPPRKRRR